MLARFLPVLCTVFSLAAPAAAAEAPRLAVVISIDQFRGDYLGLYAPFFGEGGFKRLLAGGTHFNAAHHRHSITQTAPGHASILTGTFARVHGVTANEWLDRETWEQVNSVEDKAAPLVGISPAELGPVAARNPAKTGRSPRTLHAETVGDRLKAKYGAGTKIFAASNKDRSAILLGGRKADAAYWDEFGKMVTSTYYRPELPAWVAAFNAEQRAHAAFGKTWDRLREAALYEKLHGPDDEPAESDSAGLGRTFPKRITGGKETLGPSFFSAFDNTPFAADFLGAFVERAIVEEKLGKNTGTDLLCVSFSSIDAAGHTFGPDSHEVMDAVLRMDRTIASLLACLDREVGLANCVIVLSADHGVAPLPERVLAKSPGASAGRVRTSDLDAAVKTALDQAHGALPRGQTWFVRDNLGYHLRPAALAAAKTEAAAAARTAKAALAALPYMAEVFTREELLAEPGDGDELPAMLRRSYRPGGDRDVVFCLRPNFMTKTGGGSSHGVPYPYDTHVVQLFFGGSVPKGVTRTERVGVDRIAPTLAKLLGVEAPAQARSRPLF
jgi:hypothetical protein